MFENFPLVGGRIQIITSWTEHRTDHVVPAPPMAVQSACPVIVFLDSQSFDLLYQYGDLERLMVWGTDILVE